MSRRSLRPQLNQIRGWVRQGRTDAWIAHQLEVTVQQIQAFKREQGLEPDDDEAQGAAEEVDLRAEDDAQIAAELEAEAARRAEEEAKAAEEAARKAAEKEAKAAERAARKAAAEEEAKSEPPAEDDEEEKPKRPRRRGGRTRRRAAVSGPLEGTFDHGEEGYGLWLDPAVQDDPIYAEHWAGHRPIEITIEEDQIVIRRAGADEDENED
jgi:septal ring factor EnvC (AmiA/AmiB activator)